MRFNHVIFLAVLLFASSAAACGDDDNGVATPPAVATSSSTAQPTATPSVRPTTTGIPVVDAAIKAVLANDAASLEAQFAFFKVNCSVNPRCDADEVDGTPVDAFLWAQGANNAYRRPPDLAGGVERWLSLSAQLYAVIARSRPDATAGDATYEIVFVTSIGAANELLVSAKGVTALVFDESHDPAHRALADGVQKKYLIAPLATLLTPTAIPRPTDTGVPAVDKAIHAVLADDAGALKSQFSYFTVNCSTNPSGGFPFPPQCQTGEANGSPVDVLLAVSGEGVFFRESEADRELRAWLSSGMRLYAVRDRLSPNASYGNYRYEIVFVNRDGAGNSLGVSDKGVVSLRFDLSRNPAKVAAQDGVGTFLIGPQR